MGEFLKNFWEMIIGRGHGPFAFRLVLQPLTSAPIACRTGWRDAKAGCPPYAWAVLKNSAGRRALLREGWKELARVFAFAVIIDLIYQVIVFHAIHPVQSLLVATILALLPYPLFRGPVNRLIRRWLHPSEDRPGGLPTGTLPRRT
jgi:hypothetical protein